MYRLYRKMTVSGHFFYTIYTFYLDTTQLFSNMIFALDHSNSIIKRLWLIWNLDRGHRSYYLHENYVHRAVKFHTLKFLIKWLMKFDHGLHFTISQIIFETIA